MVGIGGEQSQKTALHIIKTLKSAEGEQAQKWMSRVPVILAKEGERRTFDHFILDYHNKFVLNEAWYPWNNCADKTAFAIQYFPRDPKTEPKARQVKTLFSKALGGFFGTCLGIRACDTLPGIQSPAEILRQARAIQADQQRFFAAAPKQEISCLSDDEHRFLLK